MIVIGAGRVGTALAEQSRAKSVACTLVRRDSGWEHLEGRLGEPILVAVRADDLPGVLAKVPVHRRSDLVFVQNGAIRSWLTANGLQQATRGILWFAAKDGVVHAGDTSPFVGAHALATVAFFVEIGVPAAVVDWPRFSSAELQKLVWNSAFGLLCEHFACDVGTIVLQRHAELTSLVTELSRVGRAAMGVDLPADWLVDRLGRYSMAIPDWKASVGDYPWRNGWFVEQARRFRVSTPVHQTLLEATGKIRPAPP